jgi:electron transfer DM13
MRVIIITALLAGFAGFVLGNAFWYLASPLWIDREVSETFVKTDAAQTVATGVLEGADAIHPGSGKVTVIKTGVETVLRFTDFEVTNGPDLFIWLVKSAGIESSSDVKTSEWVELGVLKGNIGDQNYALPTGVDIEDFGSVVVWCKQFGVLFATADLIQS